MLHSWDVTFVARNHSRAARINFASRSISIQRCMVERKRCPLGAFRELIAVGEVAQSALSFDFTRVAELWEGEEAISCISCGMKRKLLKLFKTFCLCIATCRVRHGGAGIRLHSETTTQLAIFLSELKLSGGENFSRSSSANGKVSKAPDEPLVKPANKLKRMLTNED